MGTNYLIDTNVVIDYLANNFSHKQLLFLDSVIDNQPIISVINKIELLGFNTDKNILSNLVAVVSASWVYPLDEIVIHETIRIRKANKIKLPDAIIAATAIVTGAVLLTRNDSDFKNVKGLSVSNPHK